MIGNLTHIMRILLALTAAYFAQNCPILNDKAKDFFWVFALTMATVAIVGIILTTCEYYGIL